MALMDTIFGNNTGAEVNQTIALNAIGASASSCTAYLGAALQSTTPEVHRLFAEYLSQGLVAHEALVGLALKKGWMKPYSSPEEQLKMSYQNSESVLQATQPQQ